MSNATKLISGILLIIVTTIQFGGTFLLSVLSGKMPQFTEFQRSMYKAVSPWMQVRVKSAGRRPTESLGLSRYYRTW